MSGILVAKILVDGIRTTIRERGPHDAGEAVVLIHGNPGSGEDYEDLLASVGTIARAVAPDMPGYGKSERPKDFTYTVEGYGEFLGSLLVKLGIDRVHLVLHDFGGPWGLQWAISNLDKVGSVTLLNIGVMPNYRWHRMARLWRTPLIGELVQLITTRIGFRTVLNMENPKRFPDAFIDRMFDDADWPMKQAVLKLYRTTDIKTLNERFAQALGSRRLPALVIWGDKDPYVSSAFAQQQKNYFDAEVHVLRGVGHWPMIDEPETVEKLLVNFLSKHVRSAGQPVVGGAES